MVRKGPIYWLVEIRLKESFQDEKSRKTFEVNFGKYRNKETKIKTSSSTKKSTEKEIFKKTVAFKVLKDHIDLMHFGKLSKAKLAQTDRLINKLTSFVDVSVGIKKIKVKNAMTIPITTLLITDFINKTTLAKFNSNLKDSYSSVGVILENRSFSSEGVSGKSLVMLMKLEKEKVLDVSVDLDFTERNRWDLLQTADNILNKLKRNLISSLRIKEV